jgi:hypothetical protein
MDLHTTVTSAAAGWNGIEIWFSADDFTSTNSGDVSASFGGTIYGLTNYEAGWDASNRLFSSATSPGFDYNYRFPQSLFDFQNISGTRSAYFTSNVPYSLTLMVDIGHFGAGTGSADFTLTVPDGGITALLLGFGLLGLRIMARRRVGFAKA